MMHNSRKRPQHRRGVAMLLVIISLAMATVLTMGYLASRDNSSAIGENVVEAAKSRWASETGLEFAIAVLETEANWRTDHVNGKLIDDMVFGDSIIDIDLMDMQTDAPPTEETEYVQVLSTAITSGIAQIATAEAFAPKDYEQSVTIDLTEFVIFASGGLTMKNDSVLSEWPVAPLAGDMGGVSVGTQAMNMGALTFEGQSIPINTKVYYDSAASSFLITDAGQLEVSEVPIGDTIPLPNPPSSGVAAPESPSIYPSGNQDGGSVTLTADGRFKSAKWNHDAAVNLQGDITVVFDETLTIESKAIVVIDGNVTMVVFGEMQLSDASIELTPGSTLSLFAGDKLTLDKGYLGESRVDHSLRDTLGYAPYMDTTDISLYSINQLPGVEWKLKGDSVMKGSVYAKNVTFKIEKDSALYGRVAAQTVTLQDRGSIFFDPAMETGTGYTNTAGFLYEAAGTIKPEFKSLPSLDTSDMQVAATATKSKVKKQKGKVEIDERIIPIDPIVPPGAPTPRVVPVEWTMTSLGTNVTDWEGTQSVPTPSLLMIEIQQVRTTISGYSLTEFSGLTMLLKSAQRTSLVNSLQSAETSISGGDYATAITTLQGVLDQIDSDGAVTDIIADSAAKTRMANIVKGTITNLGKLK